MAETSTCKDLEQKVKDLEAKYQQAEQKYLKADGLARQVAQALEDCIAARKAREAERNACWALSFRECPGIVHKRPGDRLSTLAFGRRGQAIEPSTELALDLIESKIALAKSEDLPAARLELETLAARLETLRLAIAAE